MSYNGVISGYVYDDANNNGIQETTENKMAGWKVCIDKNNDNTCQENIEPFILTNNDGFLIGKKKLIIFIKVFL